MKISIFNVAAYGHVNPTLGLCEELVRRGHEVTYFVSEEFRVFVEETGAKIFPYEGSLGKQPPPNMDKMGKEHLNLIQMKMLDEASTAMSQVFSEIERNRPDLILYDSMTWVGAMLADRFDIPSVALHASYVSNAFFNIPQHIFGSSFHMQPHPEFPAAMATLAQRYDLKTYSALAFMQRQNPLNIVFMDKGFQIKGETFGPEYEFVGPCLRDGERATGTWDPTVAQGKPILLISLGTAFNNWPEFYQMCFAAFAGSDWYVVMSVGKWIHIDDLGPVPANFELHRYLPQLAILPHADVFVGHGGMNSTQEALWFNKPMVIIPQMMEQETTARRVEALGIGRFIPKSEITAESLKNAVDAVHQDEELAKRLEPYHVAARQAGGAVRAADAIEKRFSRGRGRRLAEEMAGKSKDSTS